MKANALQSKAWLLLPMEQCIAFYRDMRLAALEKAGTIGEDEMIRHFAENDLFFLLVYVLKRPDAVHPWLYARCREFEANPNDCLDLWARAHYKSTIITFSATIKEILCDPTITIGLFSHTRPIAKAFLRQIKREFEINDIMKRVWPDICYEAPQRQAPQWSEDGGITVKRHTNTKEATLEAWGLIDGQPTSKHYRLRIYDDVVTRESVTTPEQIAKTTEALQLSTNLGTKDGHARFIGTRYHMFDTYQHMIDNHLIDIVRKYPATIDGKDGSRPVFLTPAALAKTRKMQGAIVFAAQMLQDPKADNAMGFEEDWLQYHDLTLSQAKTFLNIYLMGDPSSSKKKIEGDFTAMWVVGVGADGNWYILDGLRDRLNLTERAERYIGFHRKWRPLKSGYEEYGIQADIEYFKIKMKEEVYNFDIIALGGSLAKRERILRLVPQAENRKIYIPRTLITKDYTGATVDLVRAFLTEEYIPFPNVRHDDMLDCLARMMDEDMEVTYPDPNVIVPKERDTYATKAQVNTDWTTA